LVRSVSLDKIDQYIRELEAIKNYDKVKAENERLSAEVRRLREENERLRNEVSARRSEVELLRRDSLKRSATDHRVPWARGNTGNTSSELEEARWG
jgi:predicted  nucleic acid-binding Zn-ribbon protein